MDLGTDRTAKHLDHQADAVHAAAQHAAAMRERRANPSARLFD
jgi:hypothetical protein